MVCHHSVRFVGDKHFGNGDMMFLVVEGQGST